MSRERRLSGRHITIMVVAVCIAVVGAPVAVMAATSSVNIADPTDPARKVHVTGQGQLKTVVADPISGRPARVDDLGRQVVSIANKAAVTSSPGLPGTPFVSGSASTVNVPAGKHLVVETLSVDTDVTTGHDVEVYIQFVTNGVGAYLFIPLTKDYTSAGYDDYIATASVHIYADPGSSITLSPASITGSTGTTFFTVSGYLI